MGTIERLGLLKMDFLGLRTLTVIRDTLEMMRRHGRGHEAPRTSPWTTTSRRIDMISDGDTDGVFQLEGSGMRRVPAAAMRPENFEDIIAAISLYRPGPDGVRSPAISRASRTRSSVHYEPAAA